MSPTEEILIKLEILRKMILHQEKVFKQGLLECKKYLAACREGYHNIGKAVQLQLEETEELQNTMATCTMSEWR